MYSPERLYDIWRYEISLYGGVPEEEEAMFEIAAESFGVSEERHTRRRVVSDSMENSHTTATATLERSSDQVMYQTRLDENGDIVYRKVE